MTPLTGYLLVAALLFSIGLAGALTRRNAILVLIGIELMLNAANLNLIAFWRYGPHPEALTGMMFAIFSIAVAAAEAAVGLGSSTGLDREVPLANSRPAHLCVGYNLAAEAAAPQNLRWLGDWISMLFVPSIVQRACTYAGRTSTASEFRFQFSCA